MCIGTTRAQLVLEAEAEDPTLVVRGKEYQVTSVDDGQWESLSDGVFILSSQRMDRIKATRRDVVAVAVGADMRVESTINSAAADGSTPSFDEQLDVIVPKGGFVVLAVDSDYAKSQPRRFLSENFKVGDVVKLRHQDQPISIEQMLSLGVDKGASLELYDDEMITVLEQSYTIRGRVNSLGADNRVEILLVDSDKRLPVKLNKEGEFSVKAKLRAGVNYIDVTLCQGDESLATSSKVIFYKRESDKHKEVVLWVEQFPNAKTLTNAQAVDAMMAKAAQAGFTTIGFDVKGPEGYASYRKSDLTQTPYFTVTVNPNKKVADDGFDLLEAMVSSAHKHGLKIWTSFNIFTEGNLTARDLKMLDRFPDWIEKVQHPQDRGEILSLLESARGKQSLETGSPVVLAFTNPSNMDVQNFQLLRIEEVIKNYDIDGIVLDRCRYDNMYADFSELTRTCFEEYLLQRGKSLGRFPEDIFTIDQSGAVVPGELYNDWFTFRSLTIKLFTDRVRVLVDEYKQKRDSELLLTAYVGSWYELYYQNGVNWASKNFRYNERLNFPNSELYTDDYYKTAYLENIDLLMIGTYFKTAKEVNRYITLGNILTNGEVPLVGSMSLPDLGDSQRSEVFEASMRSTSGLMIFDLCYINDWVKFTSQMQSAMKVKQK